MNTNDILNKALTIINKDVDLIQEESDSNQPLDRVSAGKITDYVKALLAVDKKEREDAKSEALETKSDDEFNGLLAEAMKTLAKDKDKSEIEKLLAED